VVRNYKRISDQYFTTTEAAVILLSLEKEPTGAKRVMRSLARRGAIETISPDHELYSPKQSRFLPDTIFQTALEWGSVDTEWFCKPEAWEAEVRLRFAALGKPICGWMPTPEEQEAARAIFRSRPVEYHPRTKVAQGMRQCAECKGVFPVDQFRTKNRGAGLISYCRPCDNRRKRLEHRRRHGNYEGEIITDRRDMFA